MISKNILRTKRASVWGLGYLGYTTMLQLQNRGFHIVTYDINPYHPKQFSAGKYPDREQIATWSRLGYLPKPDYTKIKVAKNPKELFKSSYLHMIAIPEIRKNTKKTRKNCVTSRLADIFSQNLNIAMLPLLLYLSQLLFPGI